MYLTAALSDSCFGSISGGGEKVELTLKPKWFTLPSIMLSLSPWVSSNAFYLSQASVPHTLHLKEQTRVTHAVITRHKIPI